VESTPGVGSTFYLRIPVAYRETVPVAPAAVAEEPDPFRLPILIVEDGEQEMDAYRSFFRSTEFEVFPATTIQAARQALRHVRPAAIILDIRLRGQDSWSFLAELKEGAYRDVPVVVVTNVDDEAKAVSLGADAYIPKPAERPWLMQSLRKLTRRFRHGSLLVIDDDELWRYTMRDVLRETQFEVIEARGGEEGLAQARETRPLAIFLDVNMPDLSGAMVVDRLKADTATRDIPVIMMTSMRLDSAGLEDLRASVADVVSKERLARSDGRGYLRELLLNVGLAEPEGQRAQEG
jgi:CheY-like chemotaxis protein